MKKFFCLKGMNDYLSNEILLWNFIFKKVKNIINSYGYNQIIFPIIENKNLFDNSIGLNTNINKQLFLIKNKKKEFALRPEGTSCCIRAILENGILKGEKNKLWYFGPMFRYEKPQLARYREFYQLGLESFGYNSIGIDIELILIIKKIFIKLNLYNNINLEINCIGSYKCISIYKKVLLKFLEKNKKFLQLDNLSFYRNPFSVFNTKDKYLNNFLLDKSPKIINYLEKNDYLKFIEFKKLLEINNINYNINPLLFRGMNYYNNIIFEWISNEFNKKISICSGGRYDYLSKKLGSKIEIPSVGLAIGWNRLILLFKKNNNFKKIIKDNNINIYLTITNIDFLNFTIKFSENFRKIFPKIRLLTDYSVSNIKNKIRFIKKNNIKISLIVFKKNHNEKIIYRNINIKNYSIENKKTLLNKLKIYLNFL